MPIESYRIMSVNRFSWADEAEVGGFDSATITKERSSGTPLLESGTYTFTSQIGSEFKEGWYRLEALIDEDGVYTRRAIATQKLVGASGTIDFGVDTKTVNGRSVLYPVSKRKFMARSYIPKGADAISYIGNLLRASTPAPVATPDGGFVVDDYYVFDRGESYLDAIWNLLDKAGWCLQIAGDGGVIIRKRPTVPVVTLTSVDHAILMPGVKYSHDRSEPPNRYILVDPYNGYKTTIVQNKQASSKTSYQARGYEWHDYVDEAPLHMSGESAKLYAKRQLEYLSTTVKEYEYERDFIADADVLPQHVVRAAMPSLAFEGDLRISSQSMTVQRGSGLTVKEKAGFEIKEYTA